jgi:hypothetical protein
MKLYQLLLMCFLQASPALANTPADVSLPTAAKPGEDITVSVRTEPKDHCKIEAQDPRFTQSLNLTPRDADSKGAVSWNFRIPKSYQFDAMPVIITVSKGDNVEDQCFKEIEIEK